jgi:tRNA dimethylallyltransferase
MSSRMTEADRLPPVVILLGPTGVGKTRVALEAAEALGGEIVSADSRLLYRGMDIGTAKPSADEQRRVPHHLIDVADPRETWSLALFAAAAQDALAGIHGRGRLPLVVGGTGQYVRALVEGWQPPPAPSAPDTRRRLEAEAAAQGAEAMHARLASLDPVRAGQIDARNVRRVIRALEIIEITQRPASAQRDRRPPPYRILRLGLWLPREDLYRRIDERLDGMLGAGLVEEVRGLLQAGVSPDAPSLSAIGYRQIVAYLDGRSTLTEAVTHIRRDTRQLVRRQANWFKRDDPAIIWIEARGQAAALCIEAIRRWLGAWRPTTYS